MDEGRSTMIYMWLYQGFEVLALTVIPAKKRVKKSMVNADQEQHRPFSYWEKGRMMGNM